MDDRFTTEIMTANGKTRSTEESTVYINDLDVFVKRMPVVSLGLFCKEVGYSYEWQREESPSFDQRWKSDEVQVWEPSAFKHTEQLGGEPKKWNNSVVAAKTLEVLQAEDKITLVKFMVKGSIVHGMSAAQVKSMLYRKVGKIFEKSIVPYRRKIFKENERRKVRPWAFYNKVDKK